MYVSKCGSICRTLYIIARYSLIYIFINGAIYKRAVDMTKKEQ